MNLPEFIEFLCEKYYKCAPLETKILLTQKLQKYWIDPTIPSTVCTNLNCEILRILYPYEDDEVMGDILDSVWYSDIVPWIIERKTSQKSQLDSLFSPLYTDHLIPPIINICSSYI